MITLLRLTWSNWFSYGDNNSIDFTADKVTQLVGEVGAGKSSIPLILQEVLYGKNVKGIKKADIRNRYKKVNATATLEFRKNGTPYTIDVTRKAVGVSITLLEAGIDISSHKATDTYKDIESILGLDFNLFSQLTYQSSKASLSFLTDTDTNRKKFLISLFSLEQYVDIHNKYKLAVKSATSSIDRIEGSISTINKWLQDNDGKSIQEMELKEVTESPSNDLQSERDTLLESLATFKLRNKEVTTNNKYIDLLSKINLEDLEPPRNPKINTFPILDRASNFKHDIDRETKEVHRLKGLGNHCSSCGQDIDETLNLEIVEKLKANVRANKEKLAITKEELREARSRNLKWDLYDKVTKEFESLNAQIDQGMSSDLLIEGDIKHRIDAIATTIQKAEKAIRDILDYNRLAETNNTKKKLIEDQLNSYKDQLVKEAVELDKANNVASYLILLRDMFSNKGLVSFKIQYLVQDLQDQIAKYLSKLSKGRFQLEFKLIGDKLNIVVYDNGAEIDINSLSSGETAKVNVATLLAVRSLMSSIANTQLNILFLDESINTLDSDSMDSLVDCLIQENDLNIYLMSHSFTNPLINVINIVKENKVSRLEYGIK